MTEDEQEASSTRYIAPRIMRLSSGNIALVPMVGDAPLKIIEPKDFYALVSLIPTTDELCAQTERHSQREATRQRTTRADSTARASLDDLI